MTAAVATRREDGTVIEPEWLVAAIEASGTTSAALARKLEVDGTTLYRWRKRQAPITRIIWLAITQALDLPADWVPPAGAPAPRPPDDEDDIRPDDTSVPPRTRRHFGGAGPTEPR